MTNNRAKSCLNFINQHSGSIHTYLFLFENGGVFFSSGLAYQPVADPGEGPGGLPLRPLFLDHTEATSAPKIFFGHQAPTLYQGLETPPSPTYLKVWRTPLPSTHI